MKKVNDPVEKDFGGRIEFWLGGRSHRSRGIEEVPNRPVPADDTVEGVAGELPDDRADASV